MSPLRVTAALPSSPSTLIPEPSWPLLEEWPEARQTPTSLNAPSCDLQGTNAHSLPYYENYHLITKNETWECTGSFGQLSEARTKIGGTAVPRLLEP